MKKKVIYQPNIITLTRTVLFVILFNFFVMSSIYCTVNQPKYPYFDYSVQNHLYVLILASLAIAIFSLGRYFVVGYFTSYRPAKKTFETLIPPRLSPSLLLFVFSIGIVLFILMIIAGGGLSRIFHHEGPRSTLLEPSKTSIRFGYFLWLAEGFLFVGGGLLGAAFLRKGSKLVSFNVLTVTFITFVLWSMVFSRFTALSVPLYIFLLWFQVFRRFPIRKYMLSIFILTSVALCYISVIGSIRGDVTKVKDSTIIVNSFKDVTQEIFRYLSHGQEVGIIADAIDRGKLSYSYGGATLVSFLGPFGRRMNLKNREADSIFTKFVYYGVTGIDSSSFVCWISLLGQAIIEGGLFGIIIMFFFLGVFVGFYDYFIVRKVRSAIYLHPFIQLASVDILLQGSGPLFKYTVIGTTLLIVIIISNNLSRGNLFACYKVN